MEISTVCPYCGKETKDGAIPVYQRPLEWCPRNEASGGIVEGEGVPLSATPVLGGVYVKSRYCESCRVVIVPVPDEEETAGILDKLDKKVTAWQERMSAQREERKVQREEEKREEKSRKRREKDPWEV